MRRDARARHRHPQPVPNVDCMRKEKLMSAIASTRFLRAALWLDAAASGVTGVLMLVGSDLLAGPLGLPAVLLRAAGFCCHMRGSSRSSHAATCRRRAPSGR
jgi:hypothetical protein